MNEKLRKLLFREKKKSDFEPLEPGAKAPEGHLIIHKTSSAQRCEICHQTDLFDPQTGECKRCTTIPTYIPIQDPRPPSFAEVNPPRNKQAILMGFMAVMTLGSFLYKFIVFGKLDQTAVLFIGLPAILAILTTFIPKQKTFTGTILKGLTLSLLMAATFSAAFLGEGVICIFMAAPLFYVVGILIGVVLDIIKRNPHDHPSDREKRPFSVLILLPFLLMSLEGVTDNLSFSRDEIISREKIVFGSSKDIEKALAHIPQFTTPLPFYLTLQFPRPEVSHGSGLTIGDRRTILFAGGEGQPGHLILKVTHSQQGQAIFEAVSDTSEIAHWLKWQESNIEWREVDSQHTKVRWTIKYQRKLDPSWYFGPWERYAVGLVTEYLIDNLATPKQKTDVTK